MCCAEYTSSQTHHRWVKTRVVCRVLTSTSLRSLGCHSVQAFDDMVGKDRKLHPVNDLVNFEIFEFNDGV
jgi:hypothetical protein